MTARRLFFKILIAVIAIFTFEAQGAIQWDKHPVPPTNTAGAAMGASNGALLLVGGMNETGTPGNAIRSLPPGQTQWAQSGETEFPRVGAAAAGDGKAMYCVGGMSGDVICVDVSRITFDSTTSSIHEQSLPPLPVELLHLTAALHNGQLVVVGTDAAATVHAILLDVASPNPAWRAIPTPATKLSGGFALASQHDGEKKRLYLFCTAEDQRAFCFDAKSGTWRPVASPGTAQTTTSISAVPSGQAHVLVFAEESTLLYHTITDTWVELSDSVPRVRGAQAILLGSSFVVLSDSGELYRGKAVAAASHFRWPDYLALIAYPTILILAGIFLRVKDESNNDEYFRGGKRIPWWAAGLSLVATQVSAIGFVAIPAKTFATDWVYFAGIASWFVVAPIVTHKFIPLFQRMNVTTAYEYLEGRYNFPMRMLASFLFMAIQVTRAAVVLYLPAIALSAVTGIDRIWCILAMGGVTTVYTVLGGMQTVIWTDVLQAIALLGGALLCVIIVLVDVGGFKPFFTTAIADGKFALVSEDWSISGPSLWIVFFGGVFARLASLVSDQNVVQRYQSTSSSKQAARALWTDVAVSIPWACIIFLLGTALYVFFKFNPALLDPTMDTDQIVPTFIAQRVPVGLAGLVVAAIFAASLDGSMLAVATTFVNDVYGRLRPATTARARVLLAKGMTIGLGIFATSIGVLLAVSDIKSLWDLAIQMSGLFTGALAGLFILGMFFPRVGAAAAFTGMFASSAAMYLVESRSLVHVLFYAGMGICTSVMVSLLASLFFTQRVNTNMTDQTLAPPLIRPAGSERTA